MLHRMIGVFAFACVAAPALANGFCETLWSRFDGFAKMAGVEIATDGLAFETDDGCKVRGLDMRIRKGLAVKAREITWSGAALERFAERGLPPDRVDVKIKGFRTVTSGEDPALQSVMGGRVRPPTTVEASWQWVQSTGVMRLTTTEAGRTENPSIWIDAEIDGLDFSSPALATASLATMSLKRAKTRLHLGHSVERLVLLAATADLVRGDDAGEAITNARAAIMQAIDALPDAQVPPASRAALASAARSWPHNVGTLSVEAAPTSGFGISSLLPLLVSDAGTHALSGLSVEIQYDR